MKNSVLATLLLSAIGVGCGSPAQLPLPESAATDLGRRAIRLVREGQVDEATALFDPASLPPNGRDLIRQTVSMFPKSGEPVIVQFRFFKSLVHNRLDAIHTYHVKNTHSAVLVFISAHTEAGSTRLTGFRVHPAPVNLADAYPFTILGMRPVHYVVLLGTVGVPAFILFTLVAIVRSRRRRKWLWFLFSLIGFGKLAVQWIPSGKVVFQPLVVLLLGSSAVKKPLFEPWVVAVSLPLGAILYWLTNRPRPAPTEPLAEPQVDGAA